MKKIILVLSFLIFASPAYAVIYKWIDQRGAMNFTDDYDRVPPEYRDSVEEVKIPRLRSSPPFQVAMNAPPGQSRVKAPPVEQGLIREGFFAVRLAEALRMGAVESEAEAEDMLASAGIVPQNGWIADYPLTPDIVGELQDAVEQAADSGSLPMKREEALNAFQDLLNQQGLLVRADGEPRDSEVQPQQDYGDYSNPEAINDYYDDQAPPIVTYYPPPPDYRYLYAWVPYPFWCSGYRFVGFFVLCDFHRVVFKNGRRVTISNHVVDPKTKRIVPVDPISRRIHPVRVASHTRGFVSPEAQRSASSIHAHSQERVKPGNPIPVRTKPNPGGPVAQNGRPNVSTAGSPAGPVRTPAPQPAMVKTPGGEGPRNPRATSISHLPNNLGGGSKSTPASSPGSSMPSPSGSSFSEWSGSGSSAGRSSSGWGGVRR